MLKVDGIVAYFFHIIFLYNKTYGCLSAYATRKLHMSWILNRLDWVVAVQSLYIQGNNHKPLLHQRIPLEYDNNW